MVAFIVLFILITIAAVSLVFIEDIERWIKYRNHSLKYYFLRVFDGHVSRNIIVTAYDHNDYRSKIIDIIRKLKIKATTEAYVIPDSILEDTLKKHKAAGGQIY